MNYYGFWISTEIGQKYECIRAETLESALAVVQEMYPTSEIVDYWQVNNLDN